MTSFRALGGNHFSVILAAKSSSSICRIEMVTSNDNNINNNRDAKLNSIRALVSGIHPQVKYENMKLKLKKVCFRLEPPPSNI